MYNIKKIKYFITLLTLLGSSSVAVEMQISYDQFSLNADNDALGGNTDQYYTNGIHAEFSYHRRATKGSASLDDIKKAGSPLFYFFWKPIAGGQVQEMYQGFGFGQDLYTPTNIQKTEVVAGDHPYSAWSYFSLFWGLNKEQNGREIKQRLEFQLGGIGRNANGGPAQIVVHDYVAPQSPRPQGWGQLTHGETGLRLRHKYQNLSAVRYKTKSGFEINWNLGNVKTDLSAGLVLQMGRFNNKERRKSRGFQLYGYIKPGVTLVGFNGHLQGGLTNPNKSRIGHYDFWDYIAFDLLTGNTNSEQKVIYYQYLLNDPSSYPDTGRFDYLNRYYTLYRPLFNPNGGNNILQDFGADYIVYNMLFNHGEVLDFEGKMLVLGDIMQNPINDPNERALIIDVLFREGKTLHPFLKYNAYRKMIARSNLRTYDEALHTLLYLQLFQPKNHEDSYIAKRKNVYGTLQIGVVLDIMRFSLQLKGNWQSQEFVQKKEFPSGHFYGTIHATWRW